MQVTVTMRSGLWGTHQAPAAGSGTSVLLLAGSSSVLRRKDGHTCTCLSTLLLISSKVDMVGGLRAESTATASGRATCSFAGVAILSPMIKSDATLSND